jgi:phytoene desaturase
MREAKDNLAMKTYDVVIVGAGAGGLFAAACLVNAGRSVLLLDGSEVLGGRASSVQIDGFTVNKGAIALKTGGVMEEIMRESGVALDVRIPEPRTTFRVDGKIVNSGKGGLGILLAGLTKSAAKIGAKFVDARNGDLPEEQQTTKEWLTTFTRNKTVHGLFRNLCAILFSVNPEELPARTFLSFFARSASVPIGFCPRGTIGVWQDIAAAIQARGGEIRLATPVKQIVVENGIATGVVVDGPDGPQTIAARAVISNTGVMGTIGLAGADRMGPDYVALAMRMMKPTTIINIYLASRERIIETAGLVTLANTARLCTVGDMTLTCPELAPPGWHMYVAYSVPEFGSQDDEQAEIDFALAELQREYPAFANARVLLAEKTLGNWTRAGYNMEQTTPVANLWNVGDSVITAGDGGTQACAATGRNAAQMAIDWIGKHANAA